MSLYYCPTQESWKNKKNKFMSPTDSKSGYVSANRGGYTRLIIKNPGNLLWTKPSRHEQNKDKNLYAYNLQLERNLIT